MSQLDLAPRAACWFNALSDEVHQIFVRSRAYDISDLFIDGTGMLIGIIICWLIRRRGAQRDKMPLTIA